MNQTNASPTQAANLLQKDAIPGLHIIADFHSGFTERLTNPQVFKGFVALLIEEFNLTGVGQVYHKFPEGGFKGAVCLTEADLSIQTWPAQGFLTFNIHFSNYLRDNRVTASAVYKAIQEFFQASIAFEQIISR